MDSERRISTTRMELEQVQVEIEQLKHKIWFSGKKCIRELENEKFAEFIEQIHTKNPAKGYRQIKEDLAHDYRTNVNEKRVLRICRSLGIKSTIKYKNNGCIWKVVRSQNCCIRHLGPE
jgi:hypothetical protein